MSGVSFFVPGPPQGKGRARVGSVAGRARMFTPAKTVAYESLITLAGQQAMAGRPPATGPMHLVLRAVFAVPPSWSAKKRALALAGDIRPTCKPDWDNVGKTMDALNGIVWADDAAVVEAVVSKLYGPTPGLHVTVAALGELQRLPSFESLLEAF